MGIRIHKMIGYGLDDVKYDSEKYGMIDPRFSKTGYFGRDFCEQKNDFTLDEGFDEYVNRMVTEDTSDFSNLKLLQRSRSETKKKKGEYQYKDSISECVVYDPEFGYGCIVVDSLLKKLKYSRKTHATMVYAKERPIRHQILTIPYISFTGLH